MASFIRSPKMVTFVHWLQKNQDGDGQNAKLKAAKAQSANK